MITAKEIRAFLDKYAKNDNAQLYINDDGMALCVANPCCDPDDDDYIEIGGLPEDTEERDEAYERAAARYDGEGKDWR